MSENMSVPKTQVILLGTGNPNPDPKHSGPSVAIIVNQTPYIIDFGAGLIRQAAALTPRYGGEHAALDIKNLKTAFLTHLHSDHTIGYADLILTTWVMGRDEPLEVYGPEGIKAMTEYMLNAYQEDIKYRLYGLEPVNNQGWRVNAHEIKEGIIYQDQHVEVEARLVKHGNWSNAYGFRFTTPDKIIAISGDTAPCKNILNLSQGADILVHEVYSRKMFDRKDDLWKRYHALHHTSTHELAEMVKIAQPKLLVLYHTLFWGSSEGDLIAEIGEIYDGKVLVGSDLQIFE